MRVCKICKESKDLSEFYVYRHKGRTPYPYSNCKICQGKKNSEKLEQRAKLRRESRLRAQQTVDERKSVPCADCGKQYPPYVMDFDHVGEKYRNVAKMVGRNRIEALLAEIEKCEVVCSNCHRERTNMRKHSTLV